MDFSELVFKRRSKRSYTDRMVEAEKIEKLLRAAMAAPSAGNEQPWHFIICKDRDKLKRITEFHGYASMLNEAPLAIVVVADLSLEKYDGFWVQDCAAAVQNMLLMAENLKLGACWLGVHPNEMRVKNTKDLFEMPESVQPLAIISVGYPIRESKILDRYKPERVHQEVWE